MFVPQAGEVGLTFGGLPSRAADAGQWRYNYICNTLLLIDHLLQQQMCYIGAMRHRVIPEVVIWIVIVWCWLTR